MEGILYTLLAIVLFIVVLGGIVLVHELGHFLTAKAFGIRVLEFGFGFPPRAKVLRSKGETLITLNWLPIGGFVRMDGEDGDESDERSFSAKSLRIRLAVLVAGVVLNIVLAFAIFFVIALLATPTLGARIGSVEAASPATAAGIVAGDEIYAIDGERIEMLGGSTVGSELRARAGETITLSIRHANGVEQEVVATLRPASELSNERGALGVRLSEQTYGYVGHDPVASVGIAASSVVRWGGLIIGGLGQLVDGFIKDPTAQPPASGPVGIAVTLADVLLNVGPIVLLMVAGILSVNLGVVNILPFPPLDGGRMAMLIIKRLFGTRVSLRAERLTYAVGFVFLLAFVFWITGFDIANLGSR
jgi:regulator of sigma E protease